MAAGLFQPSDASTTTSTTPSGAAQALAEFKAQILGQLLDSASQGRPSFADFAGGQRLPANLPGGLSGGIPALLAAMKQPGAFTSTQTGRTTPSTPPLISDLAQLGILGALISNSAMGGAIGTAGGNLWDKLANQFGGAAAGAAGSGLGTGVTTTTPVGQAGMDAAASPTIAGVNYSTDQSVNQNAALNDIFASWFATQG